MEGRAYTHSWLFYVLGLEAGANKVGNNPMDLLVSDV